MFTKRSVNIHKYLLVGLLGFIIDMLSSLPDMQVINIITKGFGWLLLTVLFWYVKNKIFNP